MRHTINSIIMMAALAAGLPSAVTAQDLMMRRIGMVTNATGQSGGSLGAALGGSNEHWILGAPLSGTGEAGCAYLVSNTTVHTMLTNPDPARHSYDDRFGHAVIKWGNRYAVGTPYQRINERNGEGCVYIFSEQGHLEQTLANPQPAFFASRFGCALAVDNQQRLWVGAENVGGNGAPMSAGSVYAFNNAGQCVTALTNPAPQTWDHFGRALAVMPNYLLVGVPQPNVPGGSDGGRVDVFTLSGQWVRSITNPSPLYTNADFGSALAPLDDTRFLVGAPGDASNVWNAGEAYLMDITGACLQTFRNPTPASLDRFGRSVAVLPNEGCAIGCPGQETVYLLDTNGAMRFPLLAGDTHSAFGEALWTDNTGTLLIGAPDTTGGGVVSIWQQAPLTRPEQAISNAILSTRQDTSLSLQWKPGDASGCLLAIREGSAPIGNPVDGTVYTGNTFFGSGDPFDGGYIATCDGAVNATITGLEPGHTYHFKAFAFNQSKTNVLYGTNALAFTIRTADRIAFESFEEDAGTWSFTPEPERYAVPEDFDIWLETNCIIADEGKILPFAYHGSRFWGMSDLDNGNGGQEDYHCLTFASVDISGHTAVVLRLAYYTDGYDYEPPEDLDDIRLGLMYDNGTTWTNWIDLQDNTDRWQPLVFAIPDDAPWVRLRLETRQNGNKEPGGWDYIRLTGMPSEQYTTSGVPHSWLISHGLTGDPQQVAAADQDGDGLATWQEYIAGTVPVDANSLFYCSSTPHPASNSIKLQWPGIPERFYHVQYRDDMRQTNWLPVTVTPLTCSTSQWMSITGTVPDHIRLYRIQVSR